MDNKLIEKCLLTDEERLQASLIGELPLSDYEEVIRETSILLLEKATPLIKEALLDVDEEGVISDDVIDNVLDEWAENETDEDFFKTDVQIEMEKAKTIAKAQYAIDEIKRKELLDKIEAELVESDSRNMWYLNKGFFDSLKENRYDRNI